MLQKFLFQINADLSEILLMLKFMKFMLKSKMYHDLHKKYKAEFFFQY